MKKKILSAGMALAAVISALPTSGVTAFAAEELPPSVDLRNFNGKNYVTPVKQQAPFGSCWAFALAAAAETSYLFTNGLGTEACQVNNSVDFSEKYINWYLYHAVTGDDVAQGRVRASQVGEGYDVSAAEARDKNAVYKLGGEFVLQSGFYASGFGPVDEGVEINGENPFYYSGKNRTRALDGMGYSENDDWTLPRNSGYRSAAAKAFLRESRMLPTPAGKDENGNYVFNEDGAAAIKSELAQGRAVALAFFASGSTWNYGNWAVYNYGNSVADHAVTVVGYDDNYSKDNFTRKNKNGKAITKSTPPGDGAFIVKNSWGALSEADKASATVNQYGKTVYENPNAYAWGVEDSGYFYISYYDHSITTPTSFNFDSQDSVKYQSQNLDQYDLLMTSWYSSADYDDETKMANVFDAEADGYLYQISYRTNTPDTAVSYEIYKDVNGAPDSGALLEKGEYTHEFSGNHKIDLSGEYLLKEGEKYSVVLTMKHPAGSNKEYCYTDVFPFAVNLPYTKARGVINAGESYLYSGGKWSDISENKDALVDRAYNQASEAAGSGATFTPLDLSAKDNVAIDNYPIKAVLVPASEHKSDIVRGDVNGDGSVNGVDAGLLARFTSGWENYEAKIKNRGGADINGDGTVNGADAAILSRYTSGWESYRRFFS